ncbi:hypothetical protein KCU94_g168, partial [Aureobasidium melanogenum]
MPDQSHLRLRDLKVGQMLMVGRKHQCSQTPICAIGQYSFYLLGRLRDKFLFGLDLCFGNPPNSCIGASLPGPYAITGKWLAAEFRTVVAQQEVKQSLC